MLEKPFSRARPAKAAAAMAKAAAAAVAWKYWVIAYCDRPARGVVKI
jgi:hypothetical protein